MRIPDKITRLIFSVSILGAFIIGLFYGKVLLSSYLRVVALLVLPFFGYFLLKRLWLCPAIMVGAVVFFPSSAFKQAIFYLGSFKIRLNEVFLLLMLVMVLYNHREEIKTQSKEWYKLNKLFIVTFALFFFTSLFSIGSIAISIEAILLFAVNTYGAFLLGYFSVKNEKQIINIFTMLLCIAGTVSIIGIWELISQKYFYYTIFGVWPLMKATETYTVVRGVSTLLNPNPFGAFTAMFIPLALSLFLFYTKNKKVSAFYFIVGLIVIVGTFISFSRGAFIAVVAGFLIIAIVTRKFKILIKATIITVTIVFLVNLYLPILKTFNERLTVENTVNSIDFIHRALSYKTAFMVLNEKPLVGIGFGQGARYFSMIKDPRAENISTLDNIYLNVFTETGLLGAVALFMLLGYALWLPWKKVYPAGLLKKRLTINVAAWIGLVMICICGFTFDTFSWASISVPFYLVLGILLKSIQLEWNCEQIK